MPNWDSTSALPGHVATLQALRAAIFSNSGGAHLATVAADVRGIIQIFNPGAEQMLGYAAHNVINQLAVAELFDAQALTERAASLSQQYATLVEPGFDALVCPARRGVRETCVLTQRRRDGSSLLAEVSVTPLFATECPNVPQSGTPRGPLIGYLMVCADITEKQAASDLLADSDALQRSILNALPAEIAVIDMDGVIREVNEPWRRFTRANSPSPDLSSTQTGVGVNYLAVCAAAASGTDPMSPCYAGIRGVLSGSLPSFSLEYPCHSLTEERWFVMCVMPLGDPIRTGAVIAHTEITGYQRLRKALQANHAELVQARLLADQAHCASSEFLPMGSRHLQTPLGAPLGFAILRAGGTPDLTPAQKRSMDQLLQTRGQTPERIHEILDLAAAEAGKLALSLTAVSLSEVMRESEATVEALAAKRGVHLAFVRPAACVRVSADRARLKQVLVHMLSNTIQYNRAFGTVVVECVLAQHGRLRICVADTSHGLTHAQIAQLFQPFERTGQEAGPEEASGMGLVMVKHLVELMGGAVGVESMPGQGSIFWLDLLLSDPLQIFDDDHEAIRLDRAKVTGSGIVRTLLYIEDNRANQMLVEDLLRGRPAIRMRVAPDVQSGHEAARTDQPSVILMDIKPPGTGGMQALQKLKLDPSVAHIPVIALSSQAMPADVVQATQAGFFRCLMKPVKLDEFMDTLEQAWRVTRSAATEIPRESET